MKFISDPVEPLEFDTVATIGVFDGVHLGHKKILSLLVDAAALRGLKSAVVTFDPHPETVLRSVDLPLIVPLPERVRLLEEAGVDVTVCYRFTREFSTYTAKKFIVDIVVGTLNVKSLFVGNDFVFGRDREGNAGVLGELGRCAGFEVNVVEPAIVGGEAVSSTSIRTMLQAGEVKKAAELLGRVFSLEGVVSEGEKRGKKIGFPTANLDTEWEILPKIGVYSTWAILNGKRHKSITNVGKRPTFGNNELLVETHIFDFDEDIYGERLRVEFVGRLRDERRFDGVKALVEQITKDVERAKEVLAALE
ncbi:MAG: bifunctional riboflavin kinase/FAD synthetase [Candidatus Dadabacteria bacterium]|nr:bifunctional riboflavin kinase/FAD synthetase [Candidatus Dadabacteria bacterium]